MSHEDFDVQSREYAVLRSQVGRSEPTRGQITVLLRWGAGVLSDIAGLHSRFHCCMLHGLNCCRSHCRLLSFPCCQFARRISCMCTGGGLSVGFLIPGLLSRFRSLAIRPSHARFDAECDANAQDYCWKENGFAMVERCALVQPCNATQCNGRRPMVQPSGVPHPDPISRAARASRGGREARRQPLGMHTCLHHGPPLPRGTIMQRGRRVPALHTCRMGYRTWQLLLVRACVEPGQRV